MTYRGPWNAAGMRHRQTPRTYKPCKPVGDASNKNAPECIGCSMHVCSCKKPTAKFDVGGQLHAGAVVSVDAASGRLVPFNSYATSNRVVGHAMEPLECGDKVELDLSTGRIRKFDPTAQWLGKKAKAVEVQQQPMLHGFRCDKHKCQGWSTRADDGCVLCKIDDKSAAVLADMQPEAKPVNYVLEAMKAMRERDQMLMTLKPGYEVPMSRFSPAIDIKPFSTAYLDGIDEALERASGSASSGLTGIDEGK
jgi:hypothetical protein